MTSRSDERVRALQEQVAEQARLIALAKGEFGKELDARAWLLAVPYGNASTVQRSYYT